MTIAELIKLAEAATPGPWEFTAGSDICTVDELPSPHGLMRVHICDFPLPPRRTPPSTPNSNATYIAALSPDRMIKILKAVEQMRDALEAYKDFEVGARIEMGMMNGPKTTTQYTVPAAKEALSALDEAVGK
tara:strand:- start:2482 stop:2877 length:396 start_codon:yes stop_codon:yes gene_type:complete